MYRYVPITKLFVLLQQVLTRGASRQNIGINFIPDNLSPVIYRTHHIMTSCLWTQVSPHFGPLQLIHCQKENHNCLSIHCLWGKLIMTELDVFLNQQHLAVLWELLLFLLQEQHIAHVKFFHGYDIAATSPNWLIGLLVGELLTWLGNKVLLSTQ